MKKLINKAKNSQIVDRAKSKTPAFWKKVQWLGAGLAATGTLIITLPVSLPVGLAAWGTYLLTVGTTITGLSQLTKE